jgi:hypothetical protein
MNTKINTTIEIDTHNVPNFEHWLKQNATVFDFKIVPDTTELYETDKHFKNLSKAVKQAQLERDRYYNEVRNK